MSKATDAEAEGALVMRGFMLDNMARATRAGAHPEMIMAGTAMALLDMAVATAGPIEAIEWLRHIADDKERELLADLPIATIG